jgi:glycosyltransferase involved in cell wall biosynthesis
MRICHISPHLPPDQAANALLPAHLGAAALRAGDELTYISHPARHPTPNHRLSGSDPLLPGPITLVPWRQPRVRGPVGQAASVVAAMKIVRTIWPIIGCADVVHVHSNGLLAETSAWVATRRKKPYVLTLYGTEIWHYRQRFAIDLFTRAYQRAAHVTFYSHGLMDRARELGLDRRDTSVVYPPVAAQFAHSGVEAQAQARTALGLTSRHLLLNVKRLHPLAGQKYLLEALREVIRTHPDTRLIICGTGPMLDELKAHARSVGVEGHVTFTGLVDNRALATYYAAADLFVLPSLLEACPTVALEALACGTPVISSDNPGGVELNDLFGVDVATVPREDSQVLADAIVERLERKRRTRRETQDVLEREFRPEAVARRFSDIYKRIS